MNFEDQITDTLTAHAEGEVDTGALLTRSTARGRTLRRRRHGGIALAAVAVLGVGVAVPVALWPDGRPAAPHGTFAAPSAAPSTWTLVGVQPPGLPEATGVPNAATDPGVLGSDAGLLHLSFDPVPLAAGRAAQVSEASWASRAGYEAVTVGPLDVSFSAGATAAQQELGERFTPVGEITVHGRPATLLKGTGDAAARYAVRWEPAPGVPVVGVSNNQATKEDLLAAAEALRVDRVLRCAPRFGSTGLPAGARLTGCYINSDARGATPGGQLTYTGAGGSILQIRDNETIPLAQNGDLNGASPNTTVAGHPAYWRDGGQQGLSGQILTVTDWNGRQVSVLVTGSYGRADAERAMAAMTWS
ncbi:hypothetical protein Lfu02_51340 [Longispora fulva]|uniref:Uncharacterized protein n=1 Tax=Longispora fulva TaxID=619741 RepID=A0A8J7KZG3_9ACTN|nr:hypothetical protein [Longispora fulva]MBG6140972.1 hypothetical protein [Longispora fulva]GIG60762.1 hypothetical protein Lfu02_51340 [Longispora fulva]